MGCVSYRDPKTKKINGFVCGPGVKPCRFCGTYSEALCDYPIAPGKTCDAPLCKRCRVKQGAEWQDIDFCPTHALMASGKVNPPPERARP